MAPMGIEPMISPLLGERGADCAKAPLCSARYSFMREFLT